MKDERDYESLSRRELSAIDQPTGSRAVVIITCEKELGSWTIRLNGHFVAEFWREKVARRIAMRLADALNK